MSQEKFEYKVYQTFSIRAEDFLNTKNKNKLNLNDSFGLYDIVLDSAIGFDNDNTGLNVQFKINLNPPDEKPKKIEIKNMVASFTSAGEYQYELTSPGFFDSSIIFREDSASDVKYEQYFYGKKISSYNPTLYLRRITGSNPLSQDIAGQRQPYIINPCFSFSIVYHYYSLKE